MYQVGIEVVGFRKVPAAEVVNGPTVHNNVLHATSLRSDDPSYMVIEGVRTYLCAVTVVHL